MRGSRDVDILLVEDDQDHAALILRALKEDSRVETHWAKNGEEGLHFLWERQERYARQQPSAAPRPLIVLLDIHLPKVNGHDVLRQIRREDGLRSIPVVMLTTSDRRDEIDAAYRAGANGYVTKSLMLGDFVEKLQSLKHYWTSTSEIPAA
jgi:CheY-like chemotaxis protein